MTAPLPTPTGLERAASLALLTLLLAGPALAGAIMAYATMIAALVAAGYIAIRRPGLWRHIDIAGWLLLSAYALFAALTVVSAIVHARPGELTFVVSLVALPLYIPLTLVFATHANPANARTVAALALLGVILALGVALVETGYFGLDRAGGTTIDAIRFGGTALLLGFVALVGVPATSTPWRYLWLAAPLLCLATLGLTGSRGPLVAVPILVLVALVYLVHSLRAAVIAGITLIAALTAFAVIAQGFGLFPRLVSLFEVAARVGSGGTVGDESIAIRLDIYRAGIAAFLDAPWFGHGWSQITVAPQPWFSGPVPLASYSHLHNDVLDFLVAFGLPGIACYALILAAPLAGALRSPRDSLRRTRIYAATILCAGYLVMGQSSLMLGFEYQTVLYVALAAVILGYCRDAPPGAAR